MFILLLFIIVCCERAVGLAGTLIAAVLEELKEQEYTEEWAYELAYLYHKAGMSEKCIDACDELVLWFGDGPYVERALELKMLYQPLTKTQEEKYRSFCQAKDDRAGLTHIDVEEMARAGELAETPRVTRIALGLPVGGDLDYADGLTLARALRGRTPVSET